ncbi:NIPSNAP family protein [Pseudomonas qingdaonensis]|nr:NIPSNAP family protein [Pseudomonas qingdaonensis]
MIDELREYHFTPDAWHTYWALFQDLCLPIRRDDYGVLLGLWHEQVGDTVCFRHLWRYDSLDARAQLRGELIKLDAWRNEFLPQAGAQVSRQCLQVLNPRGAIGLQSLALARYLHLYRCPTGRPRR